MSKSAPATIPKGQRSAFPYNIEPMLATLAKQPVNKEGWIYEIKWDGYRIVAYKNKTKISLISRGGHNYTSKYKAVADALSRIDYEAVFDGELVAFNDDGKPGFNALQNYRHGDPVVYYVFDLLWLDGYNLMDLPL